MNVVAIVQARLNSTRLPGKVLLPIEGRPMLAHVIERAAAIPGLMMDPILAVPASDKQRITKEFWPVTVFSGAETDLVRRLCHAAMWADADIIIRITGDCPLFDPARPSFSIKLITDSVERYEIDAGWPGLDYEVFGIDTLRKADRDCHHADHREHVGPAIRECVLRRTDVPGEHGPLWNAPWLAVDTAEDLERVRKVFAHLDDPKDFSLAATLRAWEKAGRP